MSVRDVHLFLWILTIIYRDAIDAQFQVFQAPESMNAVVGSNVTFYCTFPIFQDNSDVEVYWWKLGESKFLQTDSRKKILRFKQGGGSFHFLNISARDSGVYYCGVRTLGSRIVNGTGSTIKVSVPPTPLRILSKVRELNSSVMDLVCKTDAFYPEALNLTWYKNGVEIKIDTETTKTLNLDGVYQVSSLLKVTQSVGSGSVYTCQVSHLTLPVPANVTFAVAISTEEGDNSTLYHSIIFGSTGTALIFLLLIVIIRSRRHQKTRKGTGRSVASPGHRDETFMEGATDDLMLYTALDLNTSNITARVIHPEERNVYGQNGQARADNKLTYAALDLSGSKKTGKPKPDDKNTVYAHLRTTVHKGATEVIYREATVS